MLTACFSPMPGSRSYVAQQRQPVLKVKGSQRALKRQPELNHRERDIRLDPDDRRSCAPQTNGTGQLTQRSGREGVQNRERRYVDADPGRAALANSVRQ